MAKFRGLSQCKGNCSGHRAGARYARRGGATPSPYSSSFNKGMQIQQGTFKKAKRIPKQKRNKRFQGKK